MGNPVNAAINTMNMAHVLAAMPEADPAWKHYGSGFTRRMKRPLVSFPEIKQSRTWPFSHTTITSWSLPHRPGLGCGKGRSPIGIDTDGHTPACPIPFRQRAPLL